MNHRWNVLLPAKTLAADNVETISMKGLDPISELTVLYKGTNNGSTPTAHPAKLITKIQVVDGSEVIAELSGAQVVALNYYHYKTAHPQGINYIDNNQCWIIAHIPFGRWLWDPMLALDPARFNNLQIIITTDLNGGGSACDAGSLEVTIAMFDAKKIAPVGFLVSKQIYTYTLVASGVETIELPVDRAMKMLMVQSYYPTKAINSNMSKLRLSEDHDKRLILENEISDLVKVLQQDYDQYMEHFRANTTATAVAHYFTPCYNEDLVLQNILAAPDYYGLTIGYGGQISLDAQTGGEVGGFCAGWAPLGGLAIEFGDPWDYEDWYDLPKIGAKSLSLQIQAGAAAVGTVQVVTQQMKRY